MTDVNKEGDEKIRLLREALEGREDWEYKGIPLSIQEPEPFDKVVLLTGKLSSDEMHNLWAYIRTLEKEVERLNSIIEEQHERKED